MRDQVFISYSHRDTKLMEELRTHLVPYVRSGSVSAWSDKEIAPGSKWRIEIEAALEKTRVAVLLVSPRFLASEFIHEHELGPLLKEAEAGGVQILWTQIRASSYQETALEKLQAVVSPPAKPLAEMEAERDGAWVQLCKEIKKAVVGAPAPSHAEPGAGVWVRAGWARRFGLPPGGGGTVPAGLPGDAGAGEAGAGVGREEPE